jgi:Uma2 family endonuclease
MNEILIKPLVGEATQPATTQAAEGLPRRRWTVAEIIRLTELGVFGGQGRPHERFELIGGEIVPMSAKGAWHETVKKELNRFWTKAAPDDIDIIPETSWYHSEIDFKEPDFFIWPRAIPLREISAATALLIVEVADTSLAYDLGRKASIYAGLGVRDYWVIDARRLVTHMHRDPIASGYRVVEQHAGGDLLMPALAPALAVRLADLGLQPADG